ncbi:SpaA isopeptide-forming pilin-related protein [Kurthia senegalensis]|uniref:SpaA isopeptide-forming pilin-related protein n=1 Tax=Kurthia senegalensis TaxID=1033740 RepID=UPI0002889BE8|nr:SpaA isopeptide-forming pilin-related protein [Kurthia senegalensis]
MKPGAPIEEGTTEIVYGSQAADLVVDFEKGAEITKQAKASQDGETFTWTIDVNTSLSKLTNAMVTDAIPAGLKVTDVQVNELVMKLNAAGSLNSELGAKVTPDVTTADHNVTVALGNTSKAYRIVITTARENKTIAATYTNVAKLSSNEQSYDSNKATATYKATVDVAKKGKMNEAGNQVAYDVTFDTKGNTLPVGSTIVDSLGTNTIYDKTFKFNALSNQDFSIYKVTDGIETLVPSSDYEVVVANGAKKIDSTIKFKKEIEGKYVVKYNVGFSPNANQIMTVANGVKFTNNATLKVPVDGTLQDFGKTSHAVDFTSKIANTYKSLRETNYETKTNKYVIVVTVPEDGHQYSVKDMVPTDGSLYDFKLESIVSSKDKNYENSSAIKQDGSTINFDLFKGDATTPAGTYTITYTMKFDADKSKSKNISNNYLVYKDGVQNIELLGVGHNLSSNKLAVNNGFKTGTLRYNSEGNYEGKDYQVGINYNLHDLTGAIVTDTLKGSQTYVKDSFKLYKWTIAKEANNTANITEITDVNWEEALVFSNELHKFTIDMDKLLPEGASKTGAYQIAYQSKFDDQITSSDLGNGIQTTYAKSASDGMVENGKVVTDTSTVPYAGNYVTKSSAQEGRLAHWNVQINGTQSKLSDVKIKDELSTGHSIIDTSFKLYKAQVKDGKLQTVGEPLELNKDYTVDVKNNGFTLAFAKAIDSAYVLTYDSYITAKSGQAITNKVSIDSADPMSTNTSTSSSIKVSNAGGSGSSGADIETGSLEVKKVDATDDDNVLVGATFELSYTDKEANVTIKQLATTDEKGIATFKDIPYSKYVTDAGITIKETAAPEGYVLNDQAIKVDVSKATQTVTIENTPKTLPIGSIQIQKVAKDHADQALAGATFALQTTDGKAVTDAEGNELTATTNAEGRAVIQDVPFGNYVLVETKAPKGYELPTGDAAKTAVSVKKDKTTNTYMGVVKIENTQKPLGEVTITKQDADSEKVLAGATFHITNEDGFDATATTDEAGLLHFTSLVEGDYTVQETAAPEGYVLNDKPFTVTVEAGQTTSKVIKNNKQTGMLIVKKVDGHNSDALANATFKIVGPNDEVYTEVSNAKGEITLANAPIGTYTIQEIVAPEGYELNSKVFTVEVTTDSTTTQVVTNQKETPKTGTLKLHKIDGETNEPLAGAEFTITGKDFKKVATSDENGLIDVTELPIGTYTIEETKAPEGYYLAKQSFQAVITPAGIYEQTVLNTKKPVVVEAPKVGNLLIHKTDAATEQSLAGAEFKITGPNGYEVTKVTNNAGYIELTDLPIGDYTVQETKAPAGYDLNDTEEAVTINDQTTFTLTVQNEKTIPQVGSLLIHKVSDTEESLAGAEFKITGPNDYEVTKVTNNAGYIELTDLPAGEYVVKETKAPAGYVLTDVEYTVNVTVQGTFTQTIVNAKEQPKVGQLTLKKVDATTEEALKDATFTVVGPNDFKQEVTTNANGMITLKDLVPGTYTIQETKAPNGYVLETTSYDVDVVANETVNQTIKNEKQTATVTLKKVDAITNDALKGAVFNLFAKDGTLVKQNLVTDQNGEIVVEKLQNGHYQFVEVKAPNGYTLDDAPLSFTMEGSDVSVEFGNTKVNESTPPTPDQPKEDDSTSVTPDKPKEDGSTTGTPDKPKENSSTTTGTNKPSESTTTTTPTSPSTPNEQIVTTNNDSTNKGATLPQTGDNTSMFTWIGVIILIAALVIFAVARRKRK